MQMNEPVTLNRDITALEIPSGTPMKLEKGTTVAISQALGGSFTVTVNGNMVRIDGEDADAIGKEKVEPPEVEEGGDIEKVVWAQLERVFDPEIPVNIVALGLVYECVLSDHSDGGKQVSIKMGLTAPGCGMGDILLSDAKRYVGRIPGVSDVKAQLVLDPPWDPSRMSEEARLELGM